jgi:uncharacterized membrane protein YfcA
VGRNDGSACVRGAAQAEGTGLTTIALVVLIAVFLLTSIISVVTGSTSLITVPVMFQFGIDARVAVATNMFALTFMSVGGALPFLRAKTINRKRLAPLVGLTLVGSVIGAELVLVTSAHLLSLIIAIAMITIVVFSLTKRDAGLVQLRAAPSRFAEGAGYAGTFALGIYGGFFSGGYVTLLTAVYIALFQMTFLEAVAITKVINIFSSAVATLIFMGRGLVDYRLGLVLGAVMFIGATIGARVVLRMQNVWLRRIFLAAVIVLALKTMLFDVAPILLR